MELRPIRIARVSDGDTVVDTEGEKYRLYGIDAPESSQPFGQNSKKHMENLAMKWVPQIYVQEHGREKYGRMLATLYATDHPTLPQHNLNYVMVEDGLAWVYRFKDEESRRHQPMVPTSLDDYEVAEEQARKEKLELWKDPQPERPSDYRKRIRAQRKRGRRRRS